AVAITQSVTGQKFNTVYGPMSALNVSEGQKVTQGQRIGGMGSTGRSTASHLHVEIHIGIWNGSCSNAVDPTNHLGS
ncbi:M23 family metallopeptidase, partial [Micrococcus sp. SIMBA_144]